MKEFIPFFITLSLVLFTIDVICIVEWSKYVKQRNWNKYFYKIPWILSFVMLIIGIFNNISRTLYPEPQFWTVGFFALTSFWYLPKFPIAIVVLIKYAFIYTKKFVYLFKKKSVSEIEVKESRRKFVTDAAWTVAGAPFVLAGYGLLEGAYNFKVHTVEIPIKNLSSALDGLKIVQISDIHTGSFYSLAPIRESVSIINSLKPDIIALTGDFVNFNPVEFREVPKEFKQLKAEIGVYGCLGNHDHYMTDENHLQLIELIKNSNIKLLTNDVNTLVINGAKLNIAGTDNYGMNQHFGDFPKTLSMLNPEAPTVLLSHDPTNWDRFINGKTNVELMLSGHTHGGQFSIKLPGMELTPVKMVYKQYAGLYNQNDQYLYINRGLGLTGPPIRVGMNPEITEIILKSV